MHSQLSGTGTTGGRSLRQRTASFLLALCLGLCLFLGLGLARPTTVRADDAINLSSLSASSPGFNGTGWTWDGSAQTITITAPGVYTFTGALVHPVDPPSYIRIVIDTMVIGSVTLVGGNADGSVFQDVYIVDQRANAALTLNSFSLKAPPKQGVMAENVDALRFTGAGPHKLSIAGSVSLYGPTDYISRDGRSGGIMSDGDLSIDTAAGSLLYVMGGSTTAAPGNGISTWSGNTLTFTGTGEVGVNPGYRGGYMAGGIFSGAITVDGPAVTVGMTGGDGLAYTSAAVATSNGNLTVSRGHLIVNGLLQMLDNNNGNYLVDVLNDDLVVAAGAFMEVRGHAGTYTVLRVGNDVTVAGNFFMETELDATPIGGPAPMATIGGTLSIPAGGSAIFRGGLGDHQMLKVGGRITQGGYLGLVSSWGLPLDLRGMHSFTDEAALLEVINGGGTEVWLIEKPAGTTFYYDPETALRNPTGTDRENFYFAGGNVLTRVSLTPLPPLTDPDPDPETTPTPEATAATGAASPQTGDTGGFGLWAALGAAGLACGLGLLRLGLRRKGEKGA